MHYEFFVVIFYLSCAKLVKIILPPPYTTDPGLNLEYIYDTELLYITCQFFYLILDDSRFKSWMRLGRMTTVGDDERRNHTSWRRPATNHFLPDDNHRGGYFTLLYFTLRPLLLHMNDWMDAELCILLHYYYC